MCYVVLVIQLLRMNGFFPLCAVETTIKTIIYTFMNRITTNMTLHKCLFWCFRCATLIITLSHELSVLFYYMLV